MENRQTRFIKLSNRMLHPSELESLITCQMAKQIKGGYLLRYKKRLFGKTWREEWVTLFDDSTLAWFKEKDRGSPEGVLVIKDAPEMMAMGQWTLRIPARPELPSGCHVVQLMAFGNRRRDKIHWLLAKNEDEVNDWMTAISNTLPPPPAPIKPREDVELNVVSSRLSSVSIYPPVPSDGRTTGAIYPEATLVPASILLVDRANNEVSDVTASVLLGRSHWGRGWGWMCMNYYNHDHADVHVPGTCDNSHDLNGYDDYGDLEFGDGDYSMSFSGDFGF